MPPKKRNKKRIKHIVRKNDHATLPKPPKKYSSAQLKALRSNLRCSQHVFSRVLGIGIRSLRNYEQGKKSEPPEVVCRLLELLENEKKRKIFFQNVEELQKFAKQKAKS